jgi:hypothetical protein
MLKKRLKNIPIHDLAAIEYVGLNGITQSCVLAIAQQLSNLTEAIQKVALLTCFSSHAFIVITEYGRIIAVKSGFNSGYRGEGPRGLAASLTLLRQRNLEIDEYVVDRHFFERLEYSCLLQRDVDAIVQGSPVRPNRWYDYIYPYKDYFEEQLGLSQYYPSVMPFEIIDERITDLAIKFRGDEDAIIIRAFRRLEDILRKRTGVAGEGASLFSRIFLSENAPVLRWDVPDKAEGKGRGNLFTATYMAYRNARVHREMEPRDDAALREFLLINELFLLEAEALTEAEIKAKWDEEAATESALRSLKETTFKASVQNCQD